MNINSRATLKALLVGTIATAAVALPSAAQAAQPGDLCRVVQVGFLPEVYLEAQGYTLLYKMPSNSSFRVVGYGAYDTYYGHGNGQADGYMWRGYVVQSSCHP